MSQNRLPPGLYIVATPIGNLGDLSARAADILSAVDIIACEDTRVTTRLLGHMGVTKAMMPYHDHNGAKVRPKLLEKLVAGARMALVSDAGTPLIADPGYKLVAEARAAGVRVFAVPGPSALTAALSVAGLPTDRVLFAGFPPPKSGARQKWLDRQDRAQATLVYYESPRRLVDSLEDSYAVLGDRPAAIVREISKLYEEVVQADLKDLIHEFKSRDIIKGEIVVLIAPDNKDTAQGSANVDETNFLKAAKIHLSRRDGARMAAELFGGRRSTYYDVLGEDSGVDENSDDGA